MNLDPIPVVDMTAMMSATPHGFFGRVGAVIKRFERWILNR